MGQGQDKIARSLLDLQPTAIIELFQLYFNTVDKENVFIGFHGGAIFDKGITWQGIGYLPIPVETEGFEINANGQLARPKIRISNKDYFVTDLLLSNNDLQFAKIIRKRTFVKYLDDVNFDGGNPWNQADASAELSNDTFVISQKTAENKVFVEFELTSPLDLDNFDINNRLILSRYCPWYYRGNGCNYVGAPKQTEDGRTISGNSLWHLTSEWQVGKNFESGDCTFIENKKISVQNKNGSSEYAKIWYVCQSGHTSSLNNYPDANETYWLRDGCNKKLDGCKLRFGNEANFYSKGSTSITNYYVDLSEKNYWSNNIAPIASVQASSNYSEGFTGDNVNDLFTGVNGNETGYTWSAESGVTNPYITLSWDEPKIINRIDIYDRASPVNNFNNAYLKFISGASVVKSGVVPINTDGSLSTSGFSNIAITDLVISGSGTSGDFVGLSEVAVFEPTGLALYNTDFNSSQIFKKTLLHIATSIEFPNGLLPQDGCYSIFNNIKPNCQYSGLNLYTSGFGSMQQVILDFATVSGTTVSKKSLKRSLFGNDGSAHHIHVQCSGMSNAGYLKLICDNESISYQLKAGESFVFKKTEYAAAFDNLKFGINDWQFSDSQQTPSGVNGQIFANIKNTTPASIYSTAIWTGMHSQNERIYLFDNESLINYNIINSDSNLHYMKSGLYAWWDMNLPSSAPYQISASNNSSLKLSLSGEYVSGLSNSTTSIMNNVEEYSSPENTNSLPFGGFPGTERYGR